MNRIIFFIYGVFCYLALLFALLCAVCFVGNFGLPNSLDKFTTVAFLPAFLINLSLLLSLALLIRSAKSGGIYRLFTAVPSPIKQSTKVLSIALIGLVFVWGWQPTGMSVWIIGDGMIQAFLKISYLSGCSIVFVSTFLINHFDLFGLRQVWCHYRGKSYARMPVLDPVHHQLARHPFYIGSLLICWSAPVMTIAHLSLAIIITVYIVIAIQSGSKTAYRPRRNYIPSRE